MHPPKFKSQMIYIFQVDSETALELQDLMRGTSAAHLSVPEAVEAPKSGEIWSKLVDKIGNI